MQLFRVVFVGGLIGLAAMSSVSAKDWPTRPVRVINPYPAGGGLDVLIRPVAHRMATRLGQTFVVENKTGANGIVGTEAAARAPGDGYVLLAGTTGALPMNAALRAKLPYDPIKDFVPITILTDSAFLMSVTPSAPIKSVQDVIDMSKRDPGSVTYASFGQGSSSHLAAELFSAAAGIEMTHVPYQGSAPAVQDVMAGRVMLMFDSMHSQMPLVRANRLRPIALAAKERSPSAPDIPTFVEQGLPTVQAGSWYGLLAPAGTPREVVSLLREEAVKAMQSPEIQNQLKDTGTRIIGGTPEEFEQQIRDDLVKWSAIVKQIGLKAE